MKWKRYISGLRERTFYLVPLFSWKRQRDSSRELARKNAVLEEQVRQLQELDSLRARLFINISHEFRTPLTLILGPIGQVLKEKTLPPDVRVLLENTFRNGGHLRDLVEEVMELTRLRAKKEGLQIHATVLRDFLEEVAAAFQPMAEARYCKLDIQYHPDPGLTLDLDRKKVWKILNNLLINAFKYSPEGCRVELIVEIQEQVVLIRVSDDGPGIHPEDLPHIFERFYRSSHPEASRESGLGIGLALSHELADLMGGGLWVESVYGHGSTFFLQLPIRERDRSEAIPVAPGSRFAGKAVETTNVPSGKTASETAPLLLLVEDKADLQAYLETLLAGDYRLAMAGNGHEALAYLANNSVPDLILSDIMMPGMDGFELLEHLRARKEWRHIPLILLTARTERHDRVRAFRTGIDDYLVKPFDAEELIVRIENSLSREEARREWLQLQEEDLSPAEADAGEDEATWLLRLEEAVKGNIGDLQFGVDRLAELVGMGRTRFYRRIRSVTGLSANEYIREIRLQTARDLLESGQISDLKTLCGQVGLRSAHYFSKLYEERFGKPPGVD
ncbi:MAG: response regulator [Lewinellaceae bacterium]|nr:response regulator [Lewinellaceae bacterium]